MDYERIYREFIADRKGRCPGGYTERHHINPRSLGGDDSAENLIKLSARDHYFAHCCLAKMYGGKMWSALFAVANMAKTDEAWRYFCRRRMVEAARAKAAARRSEHMTELWATGAFKRNRQYRAWTAEEREARRVKSLGRKQTPHAIQKTRDTRLSAAKRFNFVHDDGRTFTGHATSFRDHSGLSQSMVSCLTRGRISWAKGWMLEGTNPKAIRNRDPVVRTFQHTDGRRFVGTVRDLRSTYPHLDSGSVSKMIHGKLGTVNGWKLIQTPVPSG